MHDIPLLIMTMALVAFLIVYAISGRQFNSRTVPWLLAAVTAAVLAQTESTIKRETLATVILICAAIWVWRISHGRERT